MTRLRIRLAVALTMLTVVALAGCSSPGSPGSSSPKAAFTTDKRGLDSAAVDQRLSAPNISGATVDGGKAALADYLGKVVVVNVWGSWCNPCREEAPGLLKVSEEYKDQGVQFLGINTRDTAPENALRFEQNFKITYPSLYDPDGTQILKFPKGSLPVAGIPTTLVIDRQGRIAARAVRAIAAEDLETMLKPVLAEKSS